MYPSVRLCCAAIAVLVTGCTLEPPFQAQKVEIPSIWSTPQTSPAGVPDAQSWWSGFHDPELLQLLNRALEQNPDLEIAVDRVMQAQDMVTVAHSHKFPVLGFTGLPTDPISTQLRETSSGRLDVDSNIFELSFNASYELDFWGRIENQEIAARAQYRADMADVGTIKIGLLSSVAKAYFDLRSLDEKTQFEEQRAALANQRLAMLRLRRNAGRIDSSSVTEGELASGEDQARLSITKRERAIMLSTLALLIGENPEDLEIGYAPLRGTVSLQTPPFELPSSLLKRRPDMIAAEARMQSAHSEIAIAHADLLPEVALTAKAGFVTGATHELAHTGSTVFGIGPDFSFPIFDAGRLTAALESSRWQSDASAIEYRKTLLSALSEVERALQNLQGALEASEKAQTDFQIDQVQLAHVQSAIEAGRSTRFELITAQDRLLDIQESALLAYQSQLTGLIGLYQALGGGWSEDEPLPPHSQAIPSN